MIPIVKICNVDKDSIVITDLTLDSSEYISENIDNVGVYYEKNKFKYSETCTINIIQRNTTEKEEIIDTLFTDHSSFLDEEHYIINKDGFYTIHHLILPTIAWLQKELQREDNILDKDKDIYVCDCTNIYKYKDGELNEVTPEVISEINTEDTTISRVSIDLFSICLLYNCYVYLCKQIFLNITYKCKNSSDLDEALFKRDFIWMTINVIKYYVELNQLVEALRLLEEVNYCGGFCSQQSSFKSAKNGCGCNK